MGIAIDTSALVELERRRNELTAALAAGTEDILVPALVLAELWIGVELADSEEKRAHRARRIETLMRSVEVIPFDERVAGTYARIYAALRKAGTPIPSNDLAIAASVVHFGHTLLVGPRDEAHFRRVPGLVIRVLGESETRAR